LFLFNIFPPPPFFLCVETRAFYLSSPCSYYVVSSRLFVLEGVPLRCTDLVPLDPIFLAASSRWRSRIFHSATMDRFSLSSFWLQRIESCSFFPESQKVFSVGPVTSPGMFSSPYPSDSYLFSIGCSPFSPSLFCPVLLCLEWPTPPPSRGDLIFLLRMALRSYFSYCWRLSFNFRSFYCFFPLRIFFFLILLPCNAPPV